MYLHKQLIILHKILLSLFKHGNLVISGDYITNASQEEINMMWHSYCTNLFINQTVKCWRSMKVKTAFNCLVIIQPNITFSPTQLLTIWWKTLKIENRDNWSQSKLFQQQLQTVPDTNIHSVCKSVQKRKYVYSELDQSGNKCLSWHSYTGHRCLN